MPYGVATGGTRGHVPPMEKMRKEGGGGTGKRGREKRKEDDFLPQLPPC